MYKGSVKLAGFASRTEPSDMTFPQKDIFELIPPRKVTVSRCHEPHVKGRRLTTQIISRFKNIVRNLFLEIVDILYYNNCLFIFEEITVSFQ